MDGWINKREFLYCSFQFAFVSLSILSLATWPPSSSSSVVICWQSVNLIVVCRSMWSARTWLLGRWMRRKKSEAAGDPFFLRISMLTQCKQRPDKCCDIFLALSVASRSAAYAERRRGLLATARRICTNREKSLNAKLCVWMRNRN